MNLSLLQNNSRAACIYITSGWGEAILKLGDANLKDIKTVTLTKITPIITPYDSSDLYSRSLQFTLTSSPMTIKHLSIWSEQVVIHSSTYTILPPCLFICRWIVQFYTIQRQIKRNGGSTQKLTSVYICTYRQTCVLTPDEAKLVSI
jgi:hypothetical protein